MTDTNNKEPVIIICPVHGKFLQIPMNHLKGTGCKHCYHESQMGRPSNRLGKKLKCIDTIIKNSVK